MDKKIHLPTYVYKSKYRKDVLSALVNKPNLTQTDIIKTTSPKYISHMSRTMKELEEKKLIECKNPKDNNYKIYFPTHLGIKVAEEVKEYGNLK